MDTLDLFAGTGWGVACQRLGIHEYGVEKMPEAIATRDAARMMTVGYDVWAGRYCAVTGEIGSPPCQTFSPAGKGSGRGALGQVLAAVDSRAYKSLDELRSLGDQVGDERTALVLTPLNYWHEMRPEWVVLEQVSTVLPVWEACADVMREAGYSVWTGLLHAEQYGVPQTRKRAFLIASRVREVAPPVPTHSRYYPRNPQKLDEGVQKWVSMAEALGWGLSGRPSPTITGGGVETGGAEPIAKLARYTNRPDWAYRRPSTTIVGTFRPDIVAAPGYRTTVSRQNAPDSVRVTVQEAAVLQSYPADFPWQGSKSKQYLQVGNAVPPLLAEHVLSAVTGLPMSEV